MPLAEDNFCSESVRNLNCLKNKIIRVSNSLDPEQGRHSVGNDMDLNFLQRLSRDTYAGTSKAKVNTPKQSKSPVH